MGDDVDIPLLADCGREILISLFISFILFELCFPTGGR